MDEDKKEGFEKGYSDWIEKVTHLEEEIRKVRREMQKLISPMAVKAAEKIIGRELKSDQDTVVDIITTALKAVAQHKKVTIYVNPKELEAVEKKRDNVKGIFENLEALSIRPSEDVKSGGCIIETEAGIINAQLDNQWVILENAFEKMIKLHPEILTGRS